MIKFNWVKVEAYKAISETTLYFTPGITRVVGRNLDDLYDSNGAGKSTILQTIVFALFNRDFNGAPVNSLGNRSLNREPSVTLNFTDTVTSKVYQVENDRQNKVYRLLCDGQIISTGALETQKVIQQVLGMTYNTFKLTHFITGATINSIAEDLSQPVIFNDLLQVSEYQQLEKDIAEVVKELQVELKEITEELSGLQKSQELLTVTSKFNKDDLENKKETLETELSILNSNYNKIYSHLSTTLEEVTNEVTELKSEISSNSKTLVAGVCQHCGTKLTDDKTLALIKTKIDTLNASLIAGQDKQNSVKTNIHLAEIKFKTESKLLEEHLASNNTELAVALEVEKITELHNKGKLKDNSTTISKLTTKLGRMKEVIAYLSEARKEVKSGNIIKDVLDTFFLIVESRMIQYATLLNLTAFQVKLKPNSFGMRISINQIVKGKEIEVPIETLSNGEKTRLSLLILVSMLDAMKVVSNCETNYLVFDEASSSFDKSGVQELSLLFNHLKTLGQSCFIITHGSEMDSVPFDSELLITKLDGKSNGTISIL